MNFKKPKSKMCPHFLFCKWFPYVSFLEYAITAHGLWVDDVSTLVEKWRGQDISWWWNFHSSFFLFPFSFFPPVFQFCQLAGQFGLHKIGLGDGACHIVHQNLRRMHLWNRGVNLGSGNFLKKNKLKFKAKRQTFRMIFIEEIQVHNFHEFHFYK